MLFYPAALPLSRQTWITPPVVIHRHRRQTAADRHSASPCPDLA